MTDSEGNVLKLAPAPTIDQEIIAKLEAIVAEAKAGQIASFYMVLDRPGQGKWAERCHGHDAIKMLGIVELISESLKRTLLAD